MSDELGKILIGEHQHCAIHGDTTECSDCHRLWDTNDDPPPCSRLPPRPVRPKSLRQRIKGYLTGLAWPPFDCEQCVGQYPGQGCWCWWNGAIDVDTPPEKWRLKLRRVLRWWYGLSEEYWR